MSGRADREETAAALARPRRRGDGGAARAFGRAAWTGGALLGIGLALASYRYVAKVGPVPPNVAANRFASPWLVIHVACAATALLVGPVQFVPAVRRRLPGAHRWSGRAYVAGCLAGGVSALVLAAGASTGPIAGAGFATLGCGWFYATAQGWMAARRRRFAAHRRWMIRSFALTLAAVTLRVYLPFVFLFGLDFEDAYRAIAWLCWVPNALAAEAYLRRETPR